MKLLRNSEMAAEGYLALMKNFREFAAYGFGSKLSDYFTAGHEATEKAFFKPALEGMVKSRKKRINGWNKINLLTPDLFDNCTQNVICYVQNIFLRSERGWTSV